MSETIELAAVNKESIVKKLSEARNFYYNSGEPIMSDKEFDDLEDKLRKMDPKNAYFKKVGSAPLRESRNILLPASMGSLEKIRSDDGGLTKLLEKTAGPWYMSEKIDGVSAMLTLDKDGKEMLLTRGDGSYGSDITGLIPSIRKRGKLPKGYSVRGEIIIDHKTFGEINRDVTYKNVRNLVAGIVNRRSTDSLNTRKSLTFLLHGLYRGKTEMPFFAAIKKLKAMGWDCVWAVKLAKPTVDAIEKMLADRKVASKYLIDGLVVETKDWKLAYKGGEEQAIAIVTKVTWQKSRFGLMKPVLHIEKYTGE